MEYGLAFLFMVLLFVVIMVAISRWVFRVNDIVDRLDMIVEMLNELTPDGEDDESEDQGEKQPVKKKKK